MIQHQLSAVSTVPISLVYHNPPWQRPESQSYWDCVCSTSGGAAARQSLASWSAREERTIDGKDPSLAVVCAEDSTILRVMPHLQGD